LQAQTARDSRNGAKDVSLARIRIAPLSPNLSQHLAIRDWNGANKKACKHWRVYRLGVKSLQAQRNYSLNSLGKASPYFVTLKLYFVSVKHFLAIYMVKPHHAYLIS